MIDLYEKKFNSPDSKIKVDKLWERNSGKPNDERLLYSTSLLYGDIIDIGSGDGYGILCMLTNPNISHVSCVEIQDKALERLKQNLSVENNISIYKAIAEELPFPDNKFDTAHCGQTLEHVFDDDKAVSEIQRVIKDIAVISVPLNAGISDEHVREYTEKSIKDLLSSFFIIETTRIFTDIKNVKRIVVTCRKLT